METLFLIGILEGPRLCRAVQSITIYCQLINSPRWQPFLRLWVSTPHFHPQWPHLQLIRVQDMSSIQHTPCQLTYTLSCSHRPSLQGHIPHRSPPSMAASILQGAYMPHTLSAQPRADHINILHNIHNNVILFDFHGAILWWLAF